VQTGNGESIDDETATCSASISEWYTLADNFESQIDLALDDINSVSEEDAEALYEKMRAYIGDMTGVGCASIISDIDRSSALSSWNNLQSKYNQLRTKYGS